MKTVRKLTLALSAICLLGAVGWSAPGHAALSKPTAIFVTVTVLPGESQNAAVVQANIKLTAMCINPPNNGGLGGVKLIDIRYAFTAGGRTLTGSGLCL
jgi:hypothetical protein